MSTDLKNPDQSLISCVLMKADLVYDLPDGFCVSMLAEVRHRKIFEAVQTLVDRGEDPGVPEIALYLDSTGSLESVGNCAYLGECLECIPHWKHSTTYANQIIDRHIRTILRLAGANLIEWSRDQTIDASDALRQAEQAVFELSATAESHRPTTLAVAVPKVLEIIKQRIGQPDEVPGLATGFKDFDNLTNGLKLSMLLILAARPAMGKTALICNVVERVGAEGGRVLVFSLEQSETELVERLLSIESRVESSAIQRGRFSAEERTRILAAADVLSGRQITIDAKPNRTVGQMSSIARRLHGRSPLSLIVIDYLQIVEPEDKRAPREQQVALMSRQLKCLAKELDIPVVALAQLNRGVENRDDKRPRLADLRESGSIEQDADMVVFLHRPEVYNPEDQPGSASLIIAKNRSGPIGTVQLTWRKELMRFEDAAHSLSGIQFGSDQS